MTELTNPLSALPPIKLLLAETSIPEQAFARDRNGERLHFPSYVTLSADGDALSVAVTVRHERETYWEADDGQHVIEVVALPRSTLLRLVVDQWWPPDENDPWPSADLHVRDPLGLVESFSVTFASTDSNNPHYWIKAFAKLARETLGIPIVGSTPPNAEVSSVPPDNEVPFLR